MSLVDMAGEEELASRIRLDLGLARTFDRFTVGLLCVLLMLHANSFLMAAPMPYVRFLYLLPIWFMALGVVHLDQHYLPAVAWRQAVWRLRWSALALAGLAPFWGWWQGALSSRYCLANLALLCFTLFLFLFNLAGLARILAEARGDQALAWLARIARMAIIYLLIAPVLAFFVTVWYGNNSGHDIMVFVRRLAWWQRQLLLAPMILATVACWRLCRLRVLPPGGWRQQQAQAQAQAQG